VKENFIEVEGLTSATSRRSGPRLLLHGASWLLGDVWTGNLSASGDGLRVIGLDQPGFG